jgi:hypothetical protein|tara:strand:+ start:562 stop:855 length:294 start_codon:yes stop_codon:yes gene_type:complete
MAVRRKARRSRPKRTFVISAIEGGAAISLLSTTGAATAVQEALGGNIKGAVNTLQSNIMSNKSKILGTLGAAAIGKFAAKSFSVGRLAKLGPIAVKL